MLIHNIPHTKQIIFALCMVILMFTIKFFGGLFTNSLALLSDSLHLLTDLLSLIISYIGLKFALKPANPKYTFGHYRHGILSALLNNFLLIGISLFIMVKAVQRIYEPVVIESSQMIFFSFLGLIVNFVILLTLKSNHKNLNIKSTFLHFAGDAIGDASVLVGAIIIHYTGYMGIDTYLSGFLSIIIMINAFKITFECIHILLEATPKALELEEVQVTILNHPSVYYVTDLHIWSLSKEIISLTAHITIKKNAMLHTSKIIKELENELATKHNITHTTIQINIFELQDLDHCEAEHFHNNFLLRKKS